MNTFDKVFMVGMTVGNMQKSKEFYVDKLGFKVTKDYREDDSRWWVSVVAPGGGATITLSTFIMPGEVQSPVSFWISTGDVERSYKVVKERGVKPTSEIGNDLYGPGSGVKWFSFDDPDGNHFVVAESQK